MRKNYLTRTLLSIIMMVFVGINAWAESKWVQTDLASLTSSDVFVIVDVASSRALTNNCGTSSAPTAASVTLNDVKSEVTGGVKDEMKWTVSGNATDGYVFYPNGSTSKWLYCTNANNGVRVGVNDNKTFVLDGKYLYHKGTSRFVGVYNSQDWRCYTSNTGNILSTDTKFFKYVDEGQGGSTVTVTAPKFDVAAGTYAEDKHVLVNNYDSNYLYFYTTDGTTPACDEELIATGTSQVYDKEEGIEITESCTLKMIAVDEDGNKSSVTSAKYVINKPIVFANLEELAAADITSGTTVTVSFENVPIKSIFTTSQNYRNGVFFDIQKDGNDIEIYYKNVPEEWEVGGTLSGTMTCPWKLYSGTWELAPASGWSWTNLTYNAPVQKTITALAVSGTPTKTVYNVGDSFEPAGLVVTVTYSDESTATITSGFEWEIDYGTGNDSFVEGATSVDVMAYIGEDVMSEVYTVTGLTVNVPVVLSSISVSGTPTKTAYYDGDVFETAGLVVTGHYSDGSDKEITEGIEWTVDPETLTLETTTVDVIAGIGKVVSEVYTVNVTVAENPYKTAKISSFPDISGDINNDISYAAYKGASTTYPIVSNDCLRLYQNGGYVYIKAATGLKINSVKITTSSTYASTTVGYCVDDEDAPTKGVTVAKSSDYTISNLNNNSVSIYCLGTDNKSRLEISAIEVKYSGEAVTELKSIALSGTYPTEFTKGDEFSHEGMVVTATYTDATEKDVTSSATFTGYDMNAVGEQTVTVSYTEADITKTAEYQITVNKAPFVPVPVEEGYEIVNFASMYSQVTNNAVVEDYEGTSFAMAFAKPQSSSTPTKYYDNGKAVRAYEGNTITITAAEAIAAVDIAWASGSSNYIDDAVSIEGVGTTTAVITFSKTCRFTHIGVAYATETLATNANGVASYVTSLPVDFTEVEGLTAYLCTETSSETVTLEKAGKVPAGTAFVVIGEKSASYDLPFTSSAAAVENNLFLAGEYTVQEGDYVYALNTQGQFQKVGTGVTIPARKAYLKTEEALSKTISIFDIDETTGIASVNNEAVKTTARKAIVNGQLRIVTPNGMFTTTGAKVK